MVPPQTIPPDSMHGVFLLQVTKVVIPPSRPDKPNREFGFVHFSDRSVVEKLVQDSEKGTKPSLDGSTLEVLFLTPCLRQMIAMKFCAVGRALRPSCVWAPIWHT